MTRTTEIWIRSLVKALISGGSGGITASLGAGLLAPDKFNLDDGIGKMLALAGMVAVVAAINSVAAFLQKSPLPEPEPEPAPALAPKAQPPPPPAE